MPTDQGAGTNRAMEFLRGEIEKKEKRTVLSFEEFIRMVRIDPKRHLRNIFQLFPSMVKSYVGEGVDEYPEDPESIGFIRYDCSRLLAGGANSPFFADRLFANRFVRLIESLRQGQQNKIYIFEGPPGCGKSTFMNNLIQRFEEYAESVEGRRFELFWDINEDLFSQKNDSGDCQTSSRLQIPCPSHDHPILIIPKNYRSEYLDRLLSDKRMTQIKLEISTAKEYEWVFRDEVCTICESLFWALFDKFDGSLDRVLQTIKVRPYKFDRRLGEGISIFNPGDPPPVEEDACLTDEQIQKRLDRLFGANLVKYIFSRQAKTNGGIHVLMDIKSHNRKRLLDLHNVISDGVHKVDVVEERISSLFLGVMNPEDKENGELKEAESFQARIMYSKIPYVLEPRTEVEIYRQQFGKQIDERFLPKVLENFARLVIASRMNIAKTAPKNWVNPLKEWISDFSKYEKYCDTTDGLLLRMAIYSGVIPPWLSEEDRARFKAPLRRKIIAEAEKEGDGGITGRKSIELFGDFLARYGSGPNPIITMANVFDFFKKLPRDQRNTYIPENFIASLEKWYDFGVLSEVKESLYFYNEDQIREDILNYICAVNYDPGTKIRCKYTGREIEVTIDFLSIIGSYLYGTQLSEEGVKLFAANIQRRYVEMITQDPSQDITKTDLYQHLFNTYVKNLKEKVLQPFAKNESFREALKAFGTDGFRVFDDRLKIHVSRLIKNLMVKFGYTEQGAKEICLYVIDKKLADTFADKP